MNRMLLARRFAGFTFVPLIGTLAPLLLLPVAARVGGLDGWYSLAVGQSVGTFGSIAITYGWNVLGPALIAKSKDECFRRSLWVESLGERLLISCAVVPVATCLSWSLGAEEYRLFTVAMAVAFCLNGLTPNWYFIGAGEPRGMAVYDMIPRLVATLLAALLVFLTQSLWSYPLLWILSSLAGPLAIQHKFGWPPLFRGRSISDIREGLGKRLGVASIDALGGVYVSAPVPLAGATGSTSVAGSIASSDKLYRFGLIAVTTLGNTLQAWTLDPHAESPRRRHVAAIFAHCALGLLGLLALGLVGEFGTALLFGDEVKAATSTMWFYGVAFFAVSVSTPLIRNLLIPSLKTRFVLAGTAIGALVGVIAMLTLGRTFGANGVAAGFMLSEVMLVVVILPPALQHLSRIPRLSAGVKQ
ncbi:polysaccharide biosynthesis protein [Pseudarthrobacter sp. AG30]|nr:polysaccharide biosynthesis protein [Pseudarthrobacter sp. AG30]